MGSLKILYLKQTLQYLLHSSISYEEKEVNFTTLFEFIRGYTSNAFCYEEIQIICEFLLNAALTYAASNIGHVQRIVNMYERCVCHNRTMLWLQRRAIRQNILPINENSFSYVNAIVYDVEHLRSVIQFADLKFTKVLLKYNLCQEKCITNASRLSMRHAISSLEMFL